MQEYSRTTGGSGSGTGAAPGGKPERKPRVFTFSVTLPKLVFIAVMAGLLFSWSFIFGIILGRGMSPEDSIPQLAGVMPPPLEASNSGEETGYLKPEELTYHSSLKGAAPTPSSVPASPLPGQTGGGAPPSAQAARQTPAPAAQTAPATPPAMAPTASPAAPSATQGTESFDYVYQVAAFKDNDSAGRLLGRLKQQGLKAEIQSQKQGNTTWYRAIVHFRGTPEDTRALRDTLASLGINQILLKSKTPVR